MQTQHTRGAARRASSLIELEVQASRKVLERLQGELMQGELMQGELPADVQEELGEQLATAQGRSKELAEAAAELQSGEPLLSIEPTLPVEREADLEEQLASAQKRRSELSEIAAKLHA